MKKFYQIDENNIVINVVNFQDDLLLDEDKNLIVELGIILCKKTHGYDTKWCFSDKPVCIGDTYVPEKFISAQPCSSWNFDEDKKVWQAPIPLPELTEEQKNLNLVYIWSEEDLNWILIDENTIKPPV